VVRRNIWAGRGNHRAVSIRGSNFKATIRARERAILGLMLGLCYRSAEILEILFVKGSPLPSKDIDLKALIPPSACG
jgi:hypothetical protein